MQIKKVDGSIEEVADDYTLKTGESKVEEGAGDGVDEEKEVKENIQKFVRGETAKSLEEQADKLSTILVNKLMAGISEKREKVTPNTPAEKKDKSDDQAIVRKWFAALVNRDRTAMNDIMKAYMGEAGEQNLVQGENLVPPQLVAEVNRFELMYGISRRDMRYLPFSGPGNSRFIPRLSSSVSVFWVDKGGVKPSTKPYFGLVEQTLEKIAAIVPMTEEILEDASINIISLLGELFGEACAMEEDRVFLNGDTGAGDPFMGVIRATGIVPVPMGVGTIDDITADDLNNLIYAVPRAVRDKGKFYLHSTIFSILQKLKTNDGIYIVQSPVGDKPGTIWGRPYELVDILPDNTVTGEGEPIMFYTDLAKTCVYGDKGGMKVKLLDQGIVKSAEESPSDLNLSTQDLVALRIVKRVGYVPVLPAGIAVLQLSTES